ncbi:MAG TPA: antibiotic biosynthesis monooxygenase [Flavisolibacter sp.]|nr:antibiotic biosynthesis monooxygenase [Flavisolibacter sp.]
MYVCLTFCKFLPGSVREVRRIYNEEIAPILRKQKGNINALLMEPADKSDDFISITQWKTKHDADTYVFGGLYKRFLSKLEAYCTKAPALKTYYVEENKVSVTEFL